ncbi:MAG TPA: ribbon-helix-helix protein, CopG family [Bacillota bacterium]|nr:ribbon-helix-helix protein, CopG family [Bacillota bacterium]
MPNNILVTITLNQEANEAVIAMADKEKVSKAEIVRRAIDYYLAKIEGK